MLRLRRSCFEVSSFAATQTDNIAATNHSGLKGYSLRNTGITVGDLQKMQEVMKANANELESLKKIVGEQAWVIDDLKRNGRSSSGTSDNEVTSLKRSMSRAAVSINWKAR